MDRYDVWHYCPKRGFRKHNVHGGPLTFERATEDARWINGLASIVTAEPNRYAPAIITKATPC